MKKEKIILNKKKILFLSRFFYPHIGGVEKHVYKLSQELLKKDYIVTVITESYNNETKHNESYNGIEIIRIPINNYGLQKKIQIWIWILKNLRIFQQADIIHVHDVFYWILPFRIIFLFKKIFITFHGYEAFPIKRRNKILRKISEKLSSGNICVGKYLIKWYGTKTNLVLYGAVNLPRRIFSPKANASAVFFGRLDDQTGILDYVVAAKLIKQEIGNFKFTVVGEGVLKNKIPSDISIKKFDPDIERYLINHRYAFVSRYLSIFEAIGSRRLVFAIVDNKIKEDILEMTPFARYIVITKNPEDLKEKVIYYISNPLEEKEKIDKGYEWIKKYSWNEIMNKYVTLWAI